MNETKIEGVGQTLTGNVKEAVGKATSDQSLQGRGVADQVLGDVKQAAGSATDALANPGPLIDKARAFAKNRPWTAAALVGTLGLALFNTLRGK